MEKRRYIAAVKSRKLQIKIRIFLKYFFSDPRKKYQENFLLDKTRGGPCVTYSQWKILFVLVTPAAGHFPSALEKQERDSIVLIFRKLSHRKRKLGLNGRFISFDSNPLLDRGSIAAQVFPNPRRVSRCSSRRPRALLFRCHLGNDDAVRKG